MNLPHRIQMKTVMKTLIDNRGRSHHFVEGVGVDKIHLGTKMFVQVNCGLQVDQFVKYRMLKVNKVKMKKRRGPRNGSRFGSNIPLVFVRKQKVV
jgi:hypothetical protein